MSDLHYKWKKIIAAKLYGKDTASFSVQECQELVDDIAILSGVSVPPKGFSVPEVLPGATREENILQQVARSYGVRCSFSLTKHIIIEAMGIYAKEKQNDIFKTEPANGTKQNFKMLDEAQPVLKNLENKNNP